MKRATTAEEQIAKIEQRGMTLDIGVDKAKEVLRDIGYFRLGFYSFPFEVNYPQTKHRDHQYRAGSKISDAVALYYLDVDLRTILSKYIYRIEVNFRTNLVYQVSTKYLDCSTWFVDPAVMERKYIEAFDFKIYTDSFKLNPVIKRHHKKYTTDKYAPAWKTLEFITFGGIFTTYKNLKDVEIKQEIAGRYGIRNVSVMENYMQSIVEIRNICAHGRVLFDHTLKQRLTNGPALSINNQNEYRLDSAIKVISFILNSISENRTNDLQTEVAQLFNKFKDDAPIRWIIENCIGFTYF
ncbi:peptide ABC transporter substrate-binding protein [Bacteroidia bacterium]|nr:peptide ABC transporter substrate-binding protein [Bacteroidia bacterium]